MRFFPRTSILPVILICLLAAALPVGAHPPETATGQTRRYFDDTRTLLPPKSTVRVNNPAGNIRVVITQRADVLISAKRHNQPDQPVANEEIILEERPGQLNVAANPSEKQALDFDIEIPAEIYLRLFTETGSLRVEGKPAGLLATASQGNIDLLLPPDTDAELSFNTVQGFSKSELPVKKNGIENERIINGQLGKGGAILVANSYRGNISISRLENGKGSAPTLGRNGERRKPASEVTMPDGDTVVIESNLVLLNANVSTRSGRPVPDLKATDFEVYEDDEKQTIDSFASSNSPFNLVLLIDLSGSVREKLTVIQRAALSFLRAVRPEDKVAIVTFSDSARVMCPLTNDRRKLRERIDAIRIPQGGTNFYDALSGTLKAVLENVKGERNAVVILSDGVDNSLPPGDADHGSTVTYDELLAQVTESDAIMFPIYLDTEAETVERYGPRARLGYETARRRLQELADTTGGVVFKARTVDDLEGRYEEVAAELRNIYSLGYAPTNNSRDGKYRRIKLKVIGHEGVVVRTRNGYYAPEK